MRAPGSEKSDDRGRLRSLWRKSGALRAGILAGAIAGAVFGGAGGRIVMRIIALIDTSTDGAQTDFGTVGELTVGGTFTLTVLATIAGVIGGVIYVAVRRWLPWSRVPRGVFFGLLMFYGPGAIAISETDLNIFEPALPIFAMLAALVLLYGVSAALLTDRLHAEPEVRPGPRVELAARGLLYLVAAGILVIAAFGAYRINDGSGSCLSADQNTGGCAVPAPDPQQ